MSKSKKQRRQASPRATTAPIQASTGVSKTVATSNRSSVAEFNPDYSYVKADLKKIGILAVSFFVVLIALSFFLN